MSGPTQTLYIQSQKMLASTVQFSTYDQTPVTRPHQTHDLPQETQRYEMQTGPDMRRTIPTRFPGRARSLRTQQRAYEPVPTIADSGPRTPGGMQYWEPATRAGRTGQCSTLEHHPRHSATIRDG